MERWTGRVALVTGASVGIGAAICEALVRSGLKVIGAARGFDQVKTLSESLKDAKGSLLPLKCDLRKESDVRNLFDKIKDEFGGVDICINNAGLSNGKTLLEGTVEEMREMTDVNVIALCLCSQLAIKSMRERGVDDGHIINISSISGHAVFPHSSRFYAATKFAVRAITEGLRQEMRELKSHIRISSLSPGMVQTEFAFRAFKDEEKARKLYSSCEPLKPEDISSLVLHIISCPAHVEILANSLKDAKGSLTAIKCDVTKEEDIYNLFKEIKAKFGGVDICVNNAGISYDKTLLDGSLAEWRNMSDVNIIAPCLCSKLSIESMRERGVDDGHIINVNSTSGHRVSNFAEVHFYAGTKHALTAITEGLRQEMRDLKSHIRISRISPGMVETEFFPRMFSSSQEKAQEIYTARVCLQPEDIASSVLHIISSPPHVEINDIIVRPTEQVT